MYKNKRGFASRACEEPDDDFWLDCVEFESGSGWSVESDGLEVRSYTCPRCNRVLFQADVEMHGVIFIRCRKCRREVAIETKPRVKRIGFV